MKVCGGAEHESLIQETQKVIDGELHDEDAESLKVLQDDLEAAQREVSLAEVSHCGACIVTCTSRCRPSNPVNVSQVHLPLTCLGIHALS